MAERIETLQLRQTVPLSTYMEIAEVAQANATIIEVKINWPGGCNGLVEVAVYRGSLRLVPSNGTMALNAATPTFPFEEPLSKGERLWAAITNGDGANPHTITVTFSLRRTP